MWQYIHTYLLFLYFKVSKCHIKKQYFSKIICCISFLQNHLFSHTVFFFEVFITIHHTVYTYPHFSFYAFLSTICLSLYNERMFQDVKNLLEYYVTEPLKLDMIDTEVSQMFREEWMEKRIDILFFLETQLLGNDFVFFFAIAHYIL